MSVIEQNFNKVIKQNSIQYFELHYNLKHICMFTKKTNRIVRLNVY